MKRIPFLDYIRFIACFLVMLVHACENYYGATDGATAGPVAFLADESDRLWVSIYDGLSRISVPLFIIVSAFLLVPMKEGMTARRFYTRRFARIVPPVLVFMVLYCVVPMLTGQIDTATALNDFWHIPFNFPAAAGHLWFIFPLLSIYLFIPIISPWIKTVSAREERFFIYLFLVSTCIPYLNRFVGDVWGQCFWNEYHTLWYFSGYLGYLVFAHYIHYHLKWSVKKRMAIGAASFAVGSAVTVWSFYVQAVPGVSIPTPVAEIGWSFCTINCVAATFGAFLMFSCINKESKIVKEISLLSFSMYLMHLLWMPFWVKLIKFDMDWPTVLDIPVIAVGTFFSCYVTAKLLSFMPGCSLLFGIDKPAPKAASSSVVC